LIPTRVVTLGPPSTPVRRTLFVSSHTWVCPGPLGRTPLRSDTGECSVRDSPHASSDHAMGEQVVDDEGRA